MGNEINRCCRLDMNLCFLCDHQSSTCLKWNLPMKCFLLYLLQFPTESIFKSCIYNHVPIEDLKQMQPTNTKLVCYIMQNPCVQKSNFFIFICPCIKEKLPCIEFLIKHCPLFPLPAVTALHGITNAHKNTNIWVGLYV